MKNTILAIFIIFGTAFTGMCQQATLQEGLALKYLVQLPAEQSAHPPVIILLHGYGSDERDLFELRNAFPKNYLVIAARAPYSAGAQGYQWFETGKGDGKSKEVENSRNLVLKFIPQVTGKYNADKGQVYIIGFSQGAMMCYETGLTNPELIKGIGVLSGRLFPALKQEISNTPALKQLRIFISHGTADNRIPFTDGKGSFDYLKSIGLKPEFHEYKGMGHAISNDVMNDLVRFLSRKS